MNKDKLFTKCVLNTNPLGAGLLPLSSDSVGPHNIGFGNSPISNQEFCYHNSPLSSTVTGGGCDVTKSFRRFDDDGNFCEDWTRTYDRN